MIHYLALFHFTPTREYGVTFPSFPGCVSHGVDFEEALRNATEALAFHVDGMREDGENIPDPGIDLSDRGRSVLLKAFSETNDGGIIPIAVPLIPAPGKSVRIQVTMDSRLLSRIDAVTNNRSAFLAQAAINRLGGEV